MDDKELSVYIGISKENKDGASICFEYPITLEIFAIALILSGYKECFATKVE